MTHEACGQSSRSRWSLAGDRLAIPAALVALIFVAHYRRWPEFGLYGDDHGFFGGVIVGSWTDTLNHLWYSLTRWPQGRPLGLGLNLGALPYAVFELGGLPGLHLVGFAVAATNALLLYLLISRVAAPAAAFAGAAFFTLSPASTAHLQLVYSYNYGIAILVGLLATLAALDRRPLLFAGGLAAAFTMAEPVVMFALLIPPLLTLHRPEGWSARALRHVLLWGAIVVLLLAVRRYIGDPHGAERVGEMTSAPLRTLGRAIESAVTGPSTYATLVADRIVIPLKELDRGLAVLMAGCGLLVLGALARTQARAAASADQRPKPRPMLAALLLVAAGALVMLATYATYFRSPWHPANWRQGFMSGVHIAPALGAAVLGAGVVQAAVAALPGRLRWAALAPVAVALMLLGGFGEIVQRDHASAWTFQKKFWQAYRTLCRDATEGTYVLVLDRNLPHNRTVELFSWGSEVLPGALFRYRGTPLPPGAAAKDAAAPVPARADTGAGVIRRPPVVILTDPDPAKAIGYDGTGHRWKPTYYFMLPKKADETPTDGNVILLEFGPGGWERIEGVIPVDGGTLALRPPVGDLLGRIPATRLAPVYDL
jgi:hypothetical protein